MYCDRLKQMAEGLKAFCEGDESSPVIGDN
jgi:hypothetical protein